MIDRLLAFSVHQRWLVMIAVLMMGAFGVWNFTRLPIDAVPDITQCPGSDQYQRAGLLATGGGAAHHVPDRDGDGRPAEPREHALAVALWPQPGHRRVQGRHGHLFRAPARQRTRPAGEGLAADRHRDGDGTGLHRPRRDLHVHGRGEGGGEERRRQALHAERPADRAGLDHQASAPQRAGGQRGQHHRRLREAVPRASGSGQADGLPSELPRRR